jgi:hypothetical protein
MNAIILKPEIEEWLSSLTPVTLVPNTTLAPNTNPTVGWKTEAERLARGARRREHEPRQ